MSSYIILTILAIVFILLITNIKIVQQANAYVIERLGIYHQTWLQGLHVKLPFVDRVAIKVSLKEHVIDFPPQPVITRDNVTIQIDTVIYFQITDPRLYTYGVENPMTAIENLTATTLRNIIGELELDESLTSREHINSKITIILDEATDAWGIKINRVEVKNIDPPRDIQMAMEKQMRAEREKREAILIAEGKKRSVILTAEGKKEATILEADAAREKAIREADGKAQAILKVRQATAEGIKMLADAGATKEVLTIKSLETFEKIADGQATKLIIPSEIQGIAGLASSLTNIVSETASSKKNDTTSNNSKSE